MLKIWELKQAADAQKEARSSSVSSAQLRVQDDLDHLELPEEMRVDFEDPTNLMAFSLTYAPKVGLYKGGLFTFDFRINAQYPIEPPKVVLREKIWHPNVDYDGALCLNILREDWKPVLSLNHIAMGIQFLFLEPNKNDFLNRDAAESFQHDPVRFANEVKEAMRGGRVNGVKFDKVSL